MPASALVRQRNRVLTARPAGHLPHRTRRVMSPTSGLPTTLNHTVRRWSTSPRRGTRVNECCPVSGCVRSLGFSLASAAIATPPVCPLTPATLSGQDRITLHGNSSSSRCHSFPIAGLSTLKSRQDSQSGQSEVVLNLIDVNLFHYIVAFVRFARC